jgi:hypothetical protein
MSTFIPPKIMASIDNKITSINIIALNSGFKQLWMMDLSLLHKIKHYILLITSHLLKLFQLNPQLITQLTLLLQEICIIPIIKPLLVLTQWFQLISLHPIPIPVSSQRSSLNLQYFPSPQQVHPMYFVL